MRRDHRLLFAAAAVAVFCAAGCGGASSPSLPEPPPPPVVVAGSPGLVEALFVEAGGRTAVAPASEVALLTPLRAAEGFEPTEPLADYGLAEPIARVTYRFRDGRLVSLLVGGLSYDGHFVYVKHPGGRRVFTIPTGELRPLLALVGVTPGEG